MDIFDEKNISPMLIGAQGTAFDSGDYIHELKLDGVRCLAYLDETGAELRNKRNLRVSSIYPELSDIHKQAKSRCILDGELLVMKEGKPFFPEIQRRALMNDLFKIRLAAAKLPICFTAFDILYVGSERVDELPLMKRKELLAETLRESEQLAISRYIEKQGTALYRLAEENGLEGIVSKRKESLYHFGKRTQDWTKCKNLQDEDFVICGYIRKSKGLISLVLGQYSESELQYKGHVTMGISTDDYKRISALPEVTHPDFSVLPKGNENAVWIAARLVGTVKYMEKNPSGSLRQPVFKGLRDDKLPEDCHV